MQIQTPAGWVNGDRTGLIDSGDRGLQFGDGVFETLRIHDGVACYWARHRRRLQAGCQRLGIADVDYDGLDGEVRARAREAGNAVLKIIVTRGSGGRGYRADQVRQSNRIMRLSPLPEPPRAAAEQGIRTRLCGLRLAIQPALAGIKHLNRLEQVLARREWSDPAIAEGLLLDQQGRLVEGTMSNLFLVRDGELLTADLSDCGVAGILRSVIIDQAAAGQLVCRRLALATDDLATADEAFVCNSLIGIWPVTRVAGVAELRVGPVTRRLQQVLADRMTDDSSNWYAQ